MTGRCSWLVRVPARFVVERWPSRALSSIARMAGESLSLFRECREPPGNESCLLFSDMVAEMDVIAE